LSGDYPVADTPQFATRDKRDRKQTVTYTQEFWGAEERDLLVKDMKQEEVDTFLEDKTNTTDASNTDNDATDKTSQTSQTLSQTLSSESEYDSTSS